MNIARIACLAAAGRSALVQLRRSYQGRCRRSVLSLPPLHQQRANRHGNDRSNCFVSKFRGPACMAKYLVTHPDQ